jgi:hypothetical protein
MLHVIIDEIKIVHQEIYEALRHDDDDDDDDDNDDNDSIIQHKALPFIVGALTAYDIEESSISLGTTATTSSNSSIPLSVVEGCTRFPFYSENVCCHRIHIIIY